jgi:cob(I)alamin adenosyltransferase
MSFAIALDNSPKTITNLENLKNILDYVNDSLVDLETYPTSNQVIIDHEMVDNLYDWIDDMHKILTDYSLFSENIEV